MPWSATNPSQPPSPPTGLQGKLISVVLGGDSEVLDPGRARPLIQPAQRKAMVINQPSLGEFGAVARITYTGNDESGGGNLFTVTLFDNAG